MPKKKSAQHQENTEAVQVRIQRATMDRLREFADDFQIGYGRAASLVLEWFCSLDEESQLRLIKQSSRILQGKEQTPEESTFRFSVDYHSEEQLDSRQGSAGSRAPRKQTSKKP